MLIRHLPYFIAAAEERNLGRAASRLGISASALTRRIQNLEYELGGARLFERHHSGITLTQAGEQFLADIEVPLDQLKRAAERAERQVHGRARPLRIGYNPIGYQQQPLRRALEDLEREGECELIPMRSLHQRQALRSGALDAGLISVPFIDKGFAVETIDQFPMLLTLAATHPKADQDELALRDLADENFVGIARDWIPELHDLIAEQFERAGVEQHIVCETYTPATISNLIGMGVGVGFVTATQEASGLCQRELTDFSADLPLAFAWRESEDARTRRVVQSVGDAL